MKAFFISLLLTFFGFEITSIFFLKTGIVHDIYKDLGVTKPIHISNQGLEWRTQSAPWGAWHKSNHKDNHSRTCFNATYKSNNLGARDIEDYNNKFKANSIVALGDSFIEGYGLNQSETLTTNIQGISKRKVFNLGSSGTGPLEYYLVYKNIGLNLPHDTVLLGLLPATDFKDNDLDYIEQFGKKKYKPYYDTNDYKKNYPIIYSEKAIKNEKIGRYGLKKFLYSQSIRFNTVRLFKNFEWLKKNATIDSDNQTSHYYKSSEKQNLALIYYVQKTFELAKSKGVKKFIVLGIPDKEDFEFIDGKYQNRKKAKWESDLISISNKNEEFIYIDGFQVHKFFNKKVSYSDLFYSCDLHWNPLGALLTSKLIIEQL